MEVTCLTHNCNGWMEGDALTLYLQLTEDDWKDTGRLEHALKRASLLIIIFFILDETKDNTKNAVLYKTVDLRSERTV